MLAVTDVPANGFKEDILREQEDWDTPSELEATTYVFIYLVFSFIRVLIH